MYAHERKVHPRQLCLVFGAFSAEQCSLRSIVTDLRQSLSNGGWCKMDAVSDITISQHQQLIEIQLVAGKQRLKWSNGYIRLRGLSVAVFRQKVRRKR